jgi:tetraacyldisaccharide 4'-kinase
LGGSEARHLVNKSSTAQNLSAVLLDAWKHRGWIAQMLRPFSWLYRAVWHLRRLLYRAGWMRSIRVPAAVVVVGNVVAGGGGKTPVVIALASHLMNSRHLKVGIVSRGYGRAQVMDGKTDRKTDEIIEVEPNSSPATVGDEPLFIRRTTNVPVFVARDRGAAARRLLAAHPDIQVILSDDGLQHLGLGRDIEICVFDENGISNGLMLPAGPLREPWPRKVDLILHTGKSAAFPFGFRSERHLASYLVDINGNRLPWSSIRSRKIHAVAGIAHPEQFFRMLREQGVRSAQETALPDHYDFGSWKRSTENDETLICTEKDAVKLWAFNRAALAVPLNFKAEPAFYDAFDRLLDARLSSNAKNTTPTRHG